MRLTLACLAAAGSLTLALPAVAQDGEAASPWSGGSWSFVVGSGTDNRSKDASKTNGDGYVWGTAEWASRDGQFYAGPSFETVDSSTGANLELTASAGWRPQFGGFDWDFNAAYKRQLDVRPGADDTAWELTADMERSIGPANGRIRVQYAPDAMGPTESWVWYEARVGWDFTDRLSASAAIGRRDQQNAIDYTGWNAGFTYAVTDELELELRYHDTDAPLNTNQYEGALVAGISYAF